MHESEQRLSGRAKAPHTQTWKSEFNPATNDGKKEPTPENSVGTFTHMPWHTCPHIHAHTHTKNSIHILNIEEAKLKYMQIHFKGPQFKKV